MGIPQGTAPPGFLALAGTGAETYPAFRALAADLKTRTGFLLGRISDAASAAREGR